jgi:hypothetical protein
MYPRLVSAAAALVLASAAATALAQSYDGPARDLLVTGSVRTAGDARRGDEAAAR